jgi:hypothetical protein
MGAIALFRTAAGTTEEAVSPRRCRVHAILPEAALAGTFEVRDAPAAEIVGTPGSVTGTPSDTGGTLTAAHGAYFAKIVAVDVNGDFSAGSVEQSDTIGTGTTGSIAYTWAAGAGAAPASYRVYFGDTTGSYTRYFETTALAFTVTTNGGGVAFGPGDTPAATSGNARLVSTSAAALPQEGKSFEGMVLPRGLTIKQSNAGDRVAVIYEAY